MQDMNPMDAFSSNRSSDSVFGARCPALGVDSVPGIRSQVPGPGIWNPVPGT